MFSINIRIRVCIRVRTTIATSTGTRITSNPGIRTSQAWHWHSCVNVSIAVRNSTGMSGRMASHRSPDIQIRIGVRMRIRIFERAIVRV